MNVQELEGAELDAAVARCEGVTDLVEKDGRMCHVRQWDPEGMAWRDSMAEFVMWIDYAPSQRWDQGGPIIERERIEASPCSPVNWGNVEHRWWAQAYLPEPHVSAHGPTPLIAAMRAFVASKEPA